MVLRVAVTFYLRSRATGTRDNTAKDVSARALGQAADADCMFSLVVCTFNRADALREALRTALAQETGGRFTYEVIVVDNNSTDDTRAVVNERLGAAEGRIRYLFEPRQGKSFALNQALSSLSGEYFTIVDDDFVLPSDWLIRIFEGIRRNPGASFYSGKVLPRWSETPPVWLTRQHWSAVAMADYGDEEFLATRDNQICLLASTFRSADVRTVGGYDVRLGVIGSRIGGVEDLEILQRLWRHEKHGVYLPTVAFEHRAEPERLTRRYHRRWHRGHGRSHAIMRDPAVERSAKVLGVPRFMFRDVLENAWRVLTDTLRGRKSQAFLAETRLWFVFGYCLERWTGAGTAGVRDGGGE